MNALSRDRWVALAQSVGASRDLLPWFDRLQAAYTEPQRYFHNEQHIAECLAEFDLARHLVHRAETVELALWLHDAVYDARATDNEEQSAVLAQRCLKAAGVQPAVIQSVTRLVIATKTHEADTDEDAAVMVDVDLSILGQPEERFLQYEAQIREEYAWVPRDIFGSKRAQILDRFLARQRIYATDWFRQKYETQARNNLEMSIRTLRQLSE